MTIDFHDPRLQRQRQKMAALGPESGALFDTAAATSQFAGNRAMQKLLLMRIGNQLKDRRRNFDLRQKERINQLNFAKDQFDFEKRQGRIAATISGLGLIPKSYLSYKAYKQSGQTAEDMLAAARRIQESTSKIGG
jgi:hypothetical protein